MVTLKQKLTCRAAFLFLCLVPTLGQLWTIVSAKPDKNESGETQTSKVDSQKSSDGFQLRPVLTWMQRMKLDVESVGVGGSFDIQVAGLDAKSPLYDLPCESITAFESDHQVTLTISQVDLSISELNHLLSRYRTRQFEALLGGEKPKSLQVDQIDIQNVPVESGRGDTERIAQIRGLKIDFGSNMSCVITGRILVAQENGRHNESPFRLIAEGTDQEVVRWSGASFPIVLLNAELAKRVGPLAKISGDYLSVRKASQTTVEFSGQVDGVICESLTANLNAEGVPLATGTCSLVCEEIFLQNSRVRKFKGEVQSSSAGAVSPLIENLTGTFARWESPKSNVQFRSFLFLINYDIINHPPKQEVKSKYGGGQLIWTSDGAGILVATN